MIELIPLLNSTIDKALQYDVSAKHRLEKMQGRSLCWVLDDVGLTLVCRVVDGRLLIDDRFQACQVRVQSSLKEMIELWQHGADHDSVNLDMQGNPLALQDFAQFFKSLDIDWEAWLEDYIGPFNAHILGRIAKETKRTLWRIKDDINTFKRDEVN